MMVVEVTELDCGKVGKLIYSLRREKGMTQKALADAIHVSDRTVSKWERGIGCPDVSLLRGLSDVLGVQLEKLLSGDLKPNELDGGNMKRIQFFVCPDCGNVIASTGPAELSCCGRKLAPMAAKEVDPAHAWSTEEVEDERYLTFPHPMEKGHSLSFVAAVSYDRVLMVKLYPEQAAEVRIPQLRSGDLYICCSRHGLYKKRVGRG